VFGGPALVRACSGSAARPDARLASSAAAAGAVPAPLRALLARLLAPQARARLSQLSEVLQCEWFKAPLVGVLIFLDQLALKEPKDKQRFFATLPRLLPSFPEAIARYHVLPSLMAALEFGAAGGGGTVVLAPILDIGAQLPPAEYAAQILPCVVRLFSSNDRATRLQLLHHLPSYIDRLSDEVVNGAVLVNVLTGFGDTNAVLREATVKSALPLAPRLTSDKLHRVLFPQLKRCLGDAEPAVRVNTVICIGLIAKHVEPAFRDDEVLGAMMREMRDPFPHARSAALRAVAHALSLQGGRYFSADTVARRVAPAAAFLALDPTPDARAAALTVLEAATGCLRAEGERMREAEAAAEAAAQARAAAAAAGGGGSGGAGAAGAAGAYSSLSSAGAGDAAAQAAAASAAAGGGSYGSMVIGALGWAVSGIANRVIVSGSIDEEAAAAQAQAQLAQQQARLQAQQASLSQAQPARHARGAAGAGAGAGAGASSSGSSTSAGASGGDFDYAGGGGPSSTAARRAEPREAPAERARPSPLGGARRLPAPAAAAAEDGWGADAGWGDDDDELELPAPAPAQAPARAAPARAQVALPAGAAFPVAPVPAAAAPAPAPAAAPAAAPLQGAKSLSLKGAVKKVVVPGGSGAGAGAGASDGWGDDW